MGWRDRDYNRGEGMSAFMSNPASMLGFSLPIVTAPNLSIRLHFWFLLYAIFQIVGVIQSHQTLYYIPLDLGLMLAILCIHELGHRVLARRVGGDHSDWVLWPSGGMIPPQSPRRPLATFLANIGGIAFTIPIAALAVLGLSLLATHYTFVLTLNPFGLVQAIGGIANGPGPVNGLLVHIMETSFNIAAAIISINLFPSYWFDGGLIWQSILWPQFGLTRAVSFTCIAGMVLSVPLFFLSLFSGSFFGMIVFALIFSDCYNRRKEALASGMYESEEESYNYMDEAPEVSRKLKKKKGTWFKQASKQAAQDRAEQAQIDAILSKVHEKGLHSLTWREKRTLKKATERQRQRDLAQERR